MVATGLTRVGRFLRWQFLVTSLALAAVCGAAGPHTRKAWHDDFAYLVITHVAPVVDGEWTNYRPFGNRANPECWGDAPRQVPVFLSYLATYGIGMTAYQLAKGLLVRSNTNLADATTINAATWTCSPTKNPSNQGAVALIMSWYRAHNS